MIRGKGAYAGVTKGVPYVRVTKGVGKKPTIPVNMDMVISYPECVYIGNDDYELVVAFAPDADKSEIIKKIKEKKVSKKKEKRKTEPTDKLQFLSKEKTPDVKISVSSVAFDFDAKNKKVKLDPNPKKVDGTKVSFIFAPKEKKTGKRKITIFIEYNKEVIKEHSITITVKNCLSEVSMGYITLSSAFVGLLIVIGTLITTYLGLTQKLMTLLQAGTPIAFHLFTLV